MRHVTLDDLCAEPTISWRIEKYVPMASEHVDDAAWRQAKARAAATDYRLKKMVQSPTSRPGHYVVARTFRVPSSTISSAEANCPSCGKITLCNSVLISGVAFHKKCVPSFISADIAEDLLLFSEELQEVRKWFPPNFKECDQATPE